jgi:hypothetical protein
LVRSRRWRKIESVRRDLTQRKPQAELHVVFGFNSVGRLGHPQAATGKEERKTKGNKEDYYLFGCAGACVYLQVFSPRLKAVNPKTVS